VEWKNRRWLCNQSHQPSAAIKTFAQVAETRTLMAQIPGKPAAFDRPSFEPLPPEAGVPIRRQTRLPASHRPGKRLVTAVGLRNRFHAAVVHAFFNTVSTKFPPLFLGIAK
jgi:hypothetical protein